VIPSRSRAAAAAAFFAQGLVFISLTTRLPDFQDRWDLSELVLSLLLLMLVLLAGAGSVAAERLARHRPSELLLRTGLLLVAATLPVITLAPTRPVFVVGLAGYGLALGVIDASSNMQAVALEHRYGRPILPSFHGAWTAGGITGALVTLATSGLPLGAAAALLVVPLVVAFAPFLERDDGPVDASLPDVAWRAWWRSRRSPTWSPAWRCACPVTGWCAGTAPSWCSASARWSGASACSWS